MHWVSFAIRNLLSCFTFQDGLLQNELFLVTWVTLNNNQTEACELAFVKNLTVAFLDN